MNILVSIVFLVFSYAAFAQQHKENPFDSLLAAGKSEFKKNFAQQNYRRAVSNLEKAVALNSDDPEGHYFLGYAYSRLNAKDASSMIRMQMNLTKLSSEQFEFLNRLAPHYTGEIVVLDPYSKLTAEWGALALCYWNNNKQDSAVWALKEGKGRGGFGDFFLAMNRHILTRCSKHAMLLSSGDNFTFPLLYLQLVEKYRTDVDVIDTYLLNTTWYPQALKGQKKIAFDLSPKTMDTLTDVSWKDSVVSVRNKYAYKNFSWTLNPSLDGKYLQRSDYLLLSLLKANQFEQEVFFTTGFSEQEQLSLKDHVLRRMLSDQVNIDNKPPQTTKERREEMTVVLKNMKYINLNSEDEKLFVINTLRATLLNDVQLMSAVEKKSEVKKLFKLLDDYIPESTFPYSSKETKNYIDRIRKKNAVK